MSDPADRATQARLREAAGRALVHAYAPYSRFPVAAAVLGASGRVFTGVNVENASYGLTICAERSAVVAAVAAGERRLGACATTSRRGSSVPCGACRQVLGEFMAAEAPVWYVVDGTPASLRLGDLLPHAFDVPAGDRQGDASSSPPSSPSR